MKICYVLASKSILVSILITVTVVVGLLVRVVAVELLVVMMAAVAERYNCGCAPWSLMKLTEYCTMTTKQYKISYNI
jgi:hypothetical protein